MITIVDSFCWTSQRKILTSRETGLAFLPAFGMQRSTRAGLPLAPHVHPGCMEIVFLTKGFQIYEAGNQLFSLSGHDIFVSYTEEPHSSGNYPENICDILWFQLNLSLIPCPPGEKQSALLTSGLKNLPRTFRGNSALESQLTEAFFALASEDPLSRALGRQLFLCCLYRIIQLSKEMKLPETDQISEAIGYIHEHLYGPISLEETAASCGLSLSRFKAKFKEETGITPRTFINYLKVEQAKQMLQKQEAITDVSVRLGFDTPNYFSTLFKKYTGQSPSRYRSHFQRENRKKFKD